MSEADHYAMFGLAGIGVLAALIFSGMVYYEAQVLAPGKVIEEVNLFFAANGQPFYISRVADHTYRIFGGGARGNIVLPFSTDLRYGICYELTFSTDHTTHTISAEYREVDSSFCR